MIRSLRPLIPHVLTAACIAAILILTIRFQPEPMPQGLQIVLAATLVAAWATLLVVVRHTAR